MWWNLVIWSARPPRSVLYLLFQSPRSHSSLLNPLLCWSVIPMIKIGPKIPSLAVGLCPCPRVLDNTRCIRGRVSVSNVAMSQLATTIARVIFHGQTAEDSVGLKWLLPWIRKITSTENSSDICPWLRHSVVCPAASSSRPRTGVACHRVRESITGYFYILTKMTAAARTLTINWADWPVAPPPGTGGGQGVNNRVAENGVLAIHILIITIVTLDRWWRLARAFLPS